MTIQIMARSPRLAEIRIHEVIGADFFGDGLTSKKFAEDLDALGAVDEIVVSINSPGGAVFDGIAIFNKLKSHGATVYVIVEGLAASIASLIAMAGLRIKMQAGAAFMIHNPWTVSIGDANDMRDVAEQLDQVAGSMGAIYAERSGQSVDAVRTLMDAETWLDGQGAVAKGFADEHAGATSDAEQHRATFREFAARAREQLSALSPLQIAAALQRLEEFPMLKIAAATTPPDQNTVLAAERTRRQTIRERFGRFADDHRALLDECLDDSTITADAASSRLLAQLGARHTPLVPSAAGAVGNVEDFVSAASDALLLRAGIRVAQPHAAARDVARMSLTDIAMVCVERDPRGRTAVMRREPQVLRAALTTSDFPIILEDAIHKALRRGFEVEPASHRSWVRVTQVPDFREQNRPILGSAPELKLVLERGPYELGAFDEDGTGYSVQKFGRMIDLSWETLKNDNLGVFLERIPPALGQAARRREADNVYALFAQNSGAGPTMQDTVVLFHADHNNLVSVPGALDKAALSRGRLLLRKQTAVGGGLLSLVPRYLIVPAELETDAEILIAAATVHRSGIDANEEPGTASAVSDFSTTTPEWISRLELVVEPRLAATAFYLATSSEQVDHCELGVLDENIGGPTITQEESFNIDSMRWKARHVFRPKFLDWRGIVKVPMATP